MSDKYGCDECYVDGQLYCCERCDALLCVKCFDSHDKREHLYPISRWKRSLMRPVGLGDTSRKGYLVNGGNYAQ